jgi:hypothetical protein
MPNTNNPTLSALAAYPGKYEKALMTRFYNSMDFVTDVTWYPNVKHKLQFTELSVNDVPRPYTGNFAPVDDDLVYSPRTLTVDRFQRDVEIHPENYRQTWLAEHMAAGTSSANKDIPFAEFTWNTVVGEQGAALNDRTVWHGRGVSAYSLWASGSTYSVGDLVYFTPSGGRLGYYVCLASTTAGQSPSTHPAKWGNHNAQAITIGYGQLIKDAITASALTPVTTGTVNASSNAYDQFIAVYRALPEALKSKVVTLYCSYTDYQFMVDDYENRFGKYTGQINGVQFLPKTDNKCIVKPCTWMAGARRLVCTPKTNLIAGTDRMSDLETITTIPKHYTVEGSISGVIGFQIKQLAAIVVSDQA